jgi:hypothetical protein
MLTNTDSRTNNLRNRLHVGTRALPALVLALGLVGACDPGDGTELDEQGLTKEDLSPRIISRAVTMANGVQRQFNAVWQPQPRCRTMKAPGGTRTTCAATQPGDYLKATMHDNVGAGPGDAPFGAKWGDQPYQGCGVAAAYNVLAYFGAANPWPAGIRFTRWSDSRIMSTPSNLRADLENALNNQANGSYRVELFYGTPAFRIVANALASGGVVVALVNNGTHWQVLTGMRDSGRSDEWGAHHLGVLRHRLRLLGRVAHRGRPRPRAARLGRPRLARRRRRSVRLPVRHLPHRAQELARVTAKALGPLAGAERLSSFRFYFLCIILAWPAVSSALLR